MATTHTDIPKTYDPTGWENMLYTKWEESGFFNPDTCIKAGITDETKPTFSIVLPPPNVTGTLHAGHASMLAIEDTIVRYHRMKGDRTLWLPGTDHAAIATQSKVEKLLIAAEGKNRHDFGREAFLKKVEQFAKESHDTIVNQCKKMGSSLDWSREAYTLDVHRSLAVRTAFKRMYDDGIIYRGLRPINWSVRGQSTCSDDELVHIDRQATLYTFRYSTEFPIAISTTRPETKLGDTAVAVHPDDPRYQSFVGKTFKITAFADGPDLIITVIADRMVDQSFGTGAVGITPAHSHTDYDFYLRHRDEIQFTSPDDTAGEGIIGSDGTLTSAAGMYQGLTSIEAREKIITTLKDKGLIENEEEINQSVGTSDRYEDVIEVIPMKQWFIDVDTTFERDGKQVSLKHLMRESVSSGRVSLLPNRFFKTYTHWIDTLRPWCISRQIWFGHRIPVWYRNEEIFCGIEAPEGEDWIQDPDTLDTWFSSGLWTFSTLGWPNTEATDFKNYHPTQLLETGYDILFFWVARMILMSEYLIGTHPFETVYLHGLVRDEQGRKMSKSLGNTIDPLTVSEEHGADALRLALMAGATPGNDTKLSPEKIVAMRNFTNKLWNLARYIGMATEPTDTHSFEVISDADHDLIQKLHIIVTDTTYHLDRYELSLAIEELRAFTWDHFADWYVEIHKVEKNDALLRSAFTTILKLWHPFMPFVTEAIQETFHFVSNDSLMIAPWPHPETPHEERVAKNSFELIKTFIIAIRNIRATYHIEPAAKMTVSVCGGSEKILRDNEAVFMRLARVSEVLTCIDATPSNTIAISAGLLQIFLHLDGVIDIKTEKNRLNTELVEKTRYITSLEARLADPNFSSRAPKHILTQTESLLTEARFTAKQIETALTQLG